MSSSNSADDPFSPARPLPQRAFPSHPGTDPAGPGGGMTLRQWYKGMAIAGLCSGNMRGTCDEFSHKAAELADALLAEDEEHGKK